MGVNARIVEVFNHLKAYNRVELAKTSRKIIIRRSDF
jgi:hypothetical protein